MMRTPLLIAVLGLMTAHGPLSAAQELNALSQAIEADNAAIEAIALYPEQIRTAILEASLHPELIVRVASLQEAASASFDGLLAEYPRDQQEAIWDLTRFPGLIEKLVEGDIEKKSEIQLVLSDYPQSIHQTAIAYGRAEYDLLAEIHKLNAETHRQFERLVEKYPDATRHTYGQLLQHPEILSLLEEDLRLTVLLGDAYEKDAEGVEALAADLNLRLASEHAAGLRGGNGEMESPAYSDDAELQAVATAYRQKYAYEDDDFEGPDQSDTAVQVTDYGHPYPYWFGYPRWYGRSGVHASLNWYLTPRLHASIGFYPPTHYYVSRRHYAPVRHHDRWSKAHHHRRDDRRAKMTSPSRSHQKTQRQNQNRRPTRNKNRRPTRNKN